MYCRSAFVDLFRASRVINPERFSDSPIAEKKNRKKTTLTAKNRISHHACISFADSHFSKLAERILLFRPRSPSKMIILSRIGIQYLDPEQLITLIPRRKDEWTSHGGRRGERLTDRYHANGASPASEMTKEEKRMRRKGAGRRGGKTFDRTKIDSVRVGRSLGIN